MWISELNPHKTFHLSFVQLTYSNSFPKKISGHIAAATCRRKLYSIPTCMVNKIGPDLGFGPVVQENYILNVAIKKLCGTNQHLHKCGNVPFYVKDLFNKKLTH